MKTDENIGRLHNALDVAGCNVDGLGLESGAIVVHYRPEATGENRQAAQAIVDGWDWEWAPVPTEVSPLQAKIALRRAGFLEVVETAVASAGEEALIAYRNALTFRRDSPMLQLIAAAVPGLADALDAIFTAAASIEV